MKPGALFVLAVATRFYTPLIVLLALALLATRAPGEGAGLLAGLGAALALALHALTFGAVAARAAFPPSVARALCALGLIAVAIGVGTPSISWAAQLIEGGLFAVTVAGAALVLTVLIGRASTLRDEEW